jgi:calcium binding protein 39
VQQLVQCIIQEDLLLDLARSIRKLPFEARKDAQIIFSHILRWKPTNGRASESAISYLVSKRPEIIVELCRGYEYPESALPCGTILRQAIMQDSITAVILYDESKPGERAVQIMEVEARRKETCQGLFWNFFDWINKGSFEVSADAFNTFRVCVSPAVITALLNDKRTS